MALVKFTSQTKPFFGELSETLEAMFAEDHEPSVETSRYFKGRWWYRSQRDETGRG